MHKYILHGGMKGRDRLRVLGNALAPTTRTLLKEIAHVCPGWTGLDLGCGGGDVTRLLAQMVGAAGRIVGVDLDDEKLDIARRETHEQNIHNVEYRLGAIQDLDESSTYDIVYARFLLTHLTDPLAAIMKMLSAAKPGGVIVVEDVDYEGHFCYPPIDAVNLQVEWYIKTAQSRGVDPCIGRRLPSLFAAAGLKDIRINVLNPADAAAESDIKLMQPLTMSAIADSVVQLGLATREHVEDVEKQLWAHAHDSTTLMSMPRIVQVVGVVP